MSIKVIPYLVMDGNAKEAIDFYEKVFDAKILGIVTFGEMPANPEYPLPEEARDLIAHATIKIGDSDIMFSDTFPGQAHQIGNQVTICVTSNDPEQSKQIFESLQQDGQVSMPLQKTDFSPAYGIITDKFGVMFQIYTESMHQ
ncbi:VOC family protein [Bacillus sp. S/N-304-OC-R1]|uniref:VOC family protein n=1 Tax=Bacillus sp. S/N-304-OC-R1 TaxID=2758034 RepID=UPI001C8E871C|nr:VOC family protein [Bacillus sp. S/N-304-OC-R1]MBY0121988.1 VOC family protein [Bacillus sp. S/N-304-OC-R1]